MKNKIELLFAESIIPFENNPYKVIESVKANGILVTLVGEAA